MYSAMYNLAHKFCFCLSGDPEQASKAFLLLYELEQYVNGAIIQVTRIGRTRRFIDRKLQNITKSAKNRQYVPQNMKKDFSLTRLHCDYHFYFTCIGQISRLLKRLCEVLSDHDIEEVYIKFNKQFDKDIRDNLEHIDERAIGKKFGHDIGHISDFGNFPGDRFSFDGKEYPVNREKLNELRQIYHEIIRVLYKNYGSKDEGFMWQEQSERQRKILFRKLRKQGLI